VSARAQSTRLPDGRRHLHDGPIDLILQAFGADDAVEAAYQAAERRFVSVLDELCNELPLLRTPSGPNSPTPEGRVAQRMSFAVRRFEAFHFITPMAAVAGAVAEEILEAMTQAADLNRAFVNNGGDIALHLAPNESFAIGMVGNPNRPALFGRATISDEDATRGVATSGWRGRSFSLGIADAVTALARDAATADAAATLIANAVDLPGHPTILRRPARELDPQSDLGEKLVTRGVGALTSAEIEAALARGATQAQRFVDGALIEAAALRLQDQVKIVGAGPTLAPRERELVHAQG
jgi:uncharacterized protein